jgi:polar amino acid transport system permease protein
MEVDRQTGFAERYEIIELGHLQEGGPFFLEKILILAVAPLSELLSYGDKGYLDELVAGAIKTIIISVFAYAFGLSLGLLGAIGKLSGGRILGWLLDAYTTIFRAVPELVLIMLLYYAGTDGLNSFMIAIGVGPIELNGVAVAIFVLGFVQGAYSTEVLRAAIQAVPLGQIEAARAYGMAPITLFRRITLPAMLPFAIPGLANLWLSITKDSALVAVVGTIELANATRIAAGGAKYYLTFYVIAAGFYWTISAFSNLGFKWLENRVRRGQPKLA